MAKQFLQDLGPGTFGHWLGDDVPNFVGEESVAPENLHVGGLVEEVRLVWDHDGHEPVAVFEGYECACTGFVAGRRFECGEELRVLEGHGEREPVAFRGSGVEVGGIAEG